MKKNLKAENNLKIVREKFLLSRKQIAALLQITVHSYGAIEEGKLIVTPEILAVLSKIYGIPKSFFLEDYEKISCVLDEHTILFNQLNEEERYQKAFKNLVGDLPGTSPYKQIFKARQQIINDIKTEI